ncbi:hypothetical protein OU426_09815 [Frigidibacter sp. RF13]|uniref:hypothetical protein n=1 Tax=Frigidibacter sp. RF13 TaxID=2997340 RepID=UPI002271D3D9|nr:hypothetical protein [Frigidibacter sp. RF13]MCY1127148.1 hypothetical protein [Frigidibacter sp. RF13]
MNRSSHPANGYSQTQMPTFGAVGWLMAIQSHADHQSDRWRGERFPDRPADIDPAPAGSADRETLGRRVFASLTGWLRAGPAAQKRGA